MGLHRCHREKFLHRESSYDTLEAENSILGTRANSQSRPPPALGLGHVGEVRNNEAMPNCVSRHQSQAPPSYIRIGNFMMLGAKIHFVITGDVCKSTEKSIFFAVI